MTRRRALIASAIATAVIFVVLAVLDLRMMDAGGPGIIGFELAGTQDRAAQILAEWGSSGIDAAKASLWIDYAYIAAYGTFLVLAAWATCNGVAGPCRPQIRAVGTAMHARSAGGMAGIPNSSMSLC